MRCSRWLLALLSPLSPLSLAALVACHSSSSAPIHPDPPAASPAPSFAAAAAPAALPAAADAAPPPDPSALKLLADANNALGLDIYSAARRGHPNVALSPLSISMALTMTWAGARGDTAAQMKKVLHSDQSASSALDAEAKVLSWVNDPGQTVTLRIANRLFGEKTYSFDPTYLTETNAAFGAQLEPLDFINAPEAARVHINDWVATQTQDHIKDLIPPRGLASSTRLVLANAIYFLGRWDHPFKQEETHPAAFHLSPTSAKFVPTMHADEQVPFAHSGDAGGLKALQVPYSGGELAMVFLLPDAEDGLDALESRLSPAMLTSTLGALTPARVKIALPSFTVEATDALALRGVLGALGMPLAFDRTKADFSGIASPPSPGDRLFLGDVFHKAFVKVDEQGTEAAAATGAVLRTRALVRREPPPETFVADHPFLFVLREVSSGAILFLGRVGDPSAH